MPLSDLNASEMIIQLVKQNPKEVHLVVTGPMTNVALAMKMDPSIKEDIASIVAISGSFGLNEYAFLNATGDTPQSEWNVYVDPEAADIVYQSGVPLVALGLDVATHFTVNFSKETIDLFKRSEKKGKLLSLPKLFDLWKVGVLRPTAPLLIAWQLPMQ